MKEKNQQIIEGRFQHVFYSPRGQIEGILIDVDGESIQLVFGRHDNNAPSQFRSLKPGKMLVVNASTKGPSPKGARAHCVYRFKKLVSIEGRKPGKRKPIKSEISAGKIAYFNYARHGEANGVVLDTGDFIHMRPKGFSQFNLKVGDKVRSDGEIHQLIAGSGRVVAAMRVNGKNVLRH